MNHLKSRRSLPTPAAFAFPLAANAERDIDNLLAGETYQEQIRLRDFTPKSLVNRGIPDRPMLMNASHIRENILTQAEAQKMGLPADKRIHYHGLGKQTFLDAIDAMDDVIEVFRWKRNPKNHYTENDYIVITQVRDTNGNRVIVPIVINATAVENNVSIDTNKIKSVYGRKDIGQYLSRYTGERYLVRVKEKEPAKIVPGEKDVRRR